LLTLVSIIGGFALVDWLLTANSTRLRFILPLCLAAGGVYISFGWKSGF